MSRLEEGMRWEFTRLRFLSGVSMNMVASNAIAVKATGVLRSMRGGLRISVKKMS